MAVPASGGFTYWMGGRPAATIAVTTGGFDYWLGGRALWLVASVTAAVTGMVQALTAHVLSAPATLNSWRRRNDDRRRR